MVSTEELLSLERRPQLLVELELILGRQGRRELHRSGSTRWDAMGEDGMRWDRMGCDGMRWDAMGYDGAGWGIDGPRRGRHWEEDGRVGCAED